MKITRLFTGDDGESHFEDLDVPAGVPQRAEGVVFNEYPPGHVQDWHPAPRRQYVLTIAGEAEIEIAGGERRRFRPGDVLLAEDLTGRGHITRAVGDQRRIAVMIPLAADPAGTAKR